jgi:hypothetical protein
MDAALERRNAFLPAAQNGLSVDFHEALKRRDAALAAWMQETEQAQKDAVHPPDQRITRSMLVATTMRTAACLVQDKSSVTGFSTERCDVVGTFVLTEFHVDFLTESCGTSSHRAIMLSDLKKQLYKPICMSRPAEIMFCAADLVPGVPRQSMVVAFASAEERDAVFFQVQAAMMAL